MVIPNGPIAPREPPEVRQVALAALELSLDALQWAASRRTGQPLAEVTTGELDHALRLGVLRAATWDIAEQSGLLDPAILRRCRLFAGPKPQAPRSESLTELLRPMLLGPLGPDPRAIGRLFEALLTTETERTSASGKLVLRPGRHRKRTGSYYTPERLVTAVVESALRRWADSDAGTLGRLMLCDPALGGGAFLLESGQQLLALLERRLGPAPRSETASRRARWVTECLYGVDIDPLAVAVTEASLWLWAGDRELDPTRLGANLRVGDALCGSDGRRDEQRTLALGASFDWLTEFPAVFARGGFDVLLGNPPWVAYAGRASQGLDPARRRYYATHFASMRGYPTLHGLFVERAVRLAPRAVVALLVPSPVADLDGYRAVRRAVTQSHTVREPLLEFGQDAFAGVTQPCFALVADPDPAAEQSDHPWTLVERARAHAEASTVDPPRLLDTLGRAERLPGELFGEMGLQTTSEVTRTLLLRSPRPDAGHRYPLLEGRNVREFHEGAVQLYLRDDPELLRRARCRMRPESDYTRVRFVVRQTARVPIAALHNGQPFRNSLLAGFDHPDWPPALVVGLLNSALYRALHLALRRDARQAAFPQVKIAHLRALPRPPQDPALMSRIEEVTRSATATGVSPALRATLDALVFDLFGVPAKDRTATLRFVQARAPEHGHGAGG
ncbi:MAG: hypothetical protein JW940_35045 [Polyangiaceae bacterium]|nr:hypothetical protein [Polyangiaceae bacterium]